jgi:hypothetical protein
MIASVMEKYTAMLSEEIGKPLQIFPLSVWKFRQD